jgi:methylphosphotriester-DNA--protein-cysteine methyltransferase
MTDTEVNVQMEYAAELLLASFRKPLTIDKLADSLGISNSTLKNRFRQRFKMGVKTYFNRQRLRYAANTLTSGAPVKSVQVDFGYKSLGAFRAAFFKTYGISPAKYAKTKNCVLDSSV